MGYSYFLLSLEIIPFFMVLPFERVEVPAEDYIIQFTNFIHVHNS